MATTDDSRTRPQPGEVVYSKVTGRPAEVLDEIDGTVLVQPLATDTPEQHPADRFTRHNRPYRKGGE